MSEQLEESVARLHNLAEAFKRIGVARSKGFELIASGQLRSVTIGRRRLVSEAAIREFIAELDASA
jgi:excisionase family DNA binding protein